MTVVTETIELVETVPVNDAAPDVLLSAEGLRKTFGGEEVLKSVSLTLRRGEIALLRGDNGSGKTTLLNILSGHLAADAGQLELHTNGLREIFRFPRTFLAELNPWSHFTPERTARHGVGRTWQDVRLFSTQTLLENISVAHRQPLGENPLTVLIRPGAVRREQERVNGAAEAMLATLGLEGRERSSADMISLGQAKRVAIARTIEGGAQIVLLDEPLAGLDAAGISTVMELLTDLARRRGIALVIVEHVFNIPRLLQLADIVWTLRDGVVHADAADAVEAVSGTEELLSLGRGTELVQDVAPVIELVAGAIAAPRRITSRDLPSGARLTVIQRTTAGEGAPVLETAGLRVRRGRRIVLDDSLVGASNVCLMHGDIAFLEAPNGWGKTTLLEAIAGVLPIEEGSIRLNAKVVNHLRAWQRAEEGIALVQARHNMFGTLTVDEALRLCGALTIPEPLRDLRSRRCGDLSGGEKQKVALACAHAVPKSVYLYDEPLSALDRTSMDAFVRHLVLDRERTALIALPRGIE